MRRGRPCLDRGSGEALKNSCSEFAQWSSVGSQRAQVVAQPTLLAKLPRFFERLRRKCQGRPTVHTKSEGLGYIDGATHFRSFSRDRHALRETLQAL